ncbi:MAG: GH116 family glycosyl hydrolase [Terriglobales bacterium]
MPSTLFPTHLPRLQWSEFKAKGFDEPVCGVVFRAGDCSRGMPLGGIGTGCFDLNVDGTLGLCSIFNSFAPPRELQSPLLELNLNNRSLPLTLADAAKAGDSFCQQIHYWGHYPVADLEYELQAPISIGLRAWTPFLPGDATDSNTPAVFFDVTIRNLSDTKEAGAVACRFPGPSEAEAGSTTSSGVIRPGEYRGTRISWDGGSSIVAALDGDTKVSPVSAGSERRARVEVEFELAPGEEKETHFVLAWYVPRWAGSPAHHFRHAYAGRFAGVEDVLQYALANKSSWMERITRWQSEIYSRRKLPPWLRDQLINVLHTITEDAFWAGDSIPSESWYRPVGLFGLTESPRTTPHVCNPSDWYGILPIVFFFPELMQSLLRLYVHFQLPTGEIPLGVGEGSDLLHPAHHLFQVMNSCVHIQLIDRLWQRNHDPGILHEFYPSATRALDFLSRWDRNDDGLPELDADPIPNQFYGDWPWYGVAVHVSGFWLAALAMMERMAKAANDGPMQQRCLLWKQKAQKTLEEQLWNEDYYLLYRDSQSGKKCDTVLANQLAGQWCTRLHGLPGAFPGERVGKTLDKIQQCCVCGTAHGALNSTRPNGSADHTAARQSDGIFTGECLCLAATLVYEGDEAAGVEIARRLMTAIVLQDGAGWEMPNILDAEGRVLHGNDFYQMMILWGLPLALDSESIADTCASGGFIARILSAAGKS